MRLVLDQPLLGLCGSFAEAGGRKPANAAGCSETVLTRWSVERPALPSPLFVDFANEWLATQVGRWKSPKHAYHWHYSLVTLCQPLHARPVNAITTEDVLKVLQPLWQKTRDSLTAQRAN